MTEQVTKGEKVTGLGDYSPQPVLLVDTREQTPLVFTNLTCIRVGLVTGDYSFLGGETSFAVERKSVQDLVGCCTGGNRERFERELMRLRGYAFRRLLIVGSEQDIRAHSYRSKISPESVLGSLAAWEVRYGVPVVYSPTADAAAKLVEKWVRYSHREIFKSAQRVLKGSVAFVGAQSGDTHIYEAK